MKGLREEAIAVIGLAQVPNLDLPKAIADFRVHSVLFCEEARLPEFDLRLCVFTVVAPFSPNFNTKTDALNFTLELKALHPDCEFWLCTEQDIDPGDPPLDRYDVSRVVRIGELKESLTEWVRLK